MFRSVATCAPDGYRLGGHYWWTAVRGGPAEAVETALNGLESAAERDGCQGIVGLRIELAVYPASVGSHADGWPNEPMYAAVVHGNGIVAA